MLRTRDLWVNSPTRSRRAVTDPPPQALNKLIISQYAVCQPVFCQAFSHIAHIQRIMTFECRQVQATSLMAKHWGLKSGSKGGTHKVKGHIRSGWCRHLRKSIVHIVRNRAQKPCLSLCTRSTSIATKNKTLHDGAGTSNDGIGQFQQTYVHTRYSCNFARTI